MSSSPLRGQTWRRESLTQRVDAAIAAFMAAHRVPGMSLAVGLDGRLVLSRAYGLADLEDSVPVKSTSLFRTASIGKPMTATAVMQLWQERKLDLDAPVQTYCPAFPQKRWPVTVRQLLEHRAGIRDKTPEEEVNYKHYDTITAALGIFGNDSLLFEPGTAYRYTSYGYDVLGCAIEGASGMAYLDYMQRRIFTPARMRHTRLDDARGIIPHRVSGYVLDETGLHNSIHDDMSNRIPAGGFVSTSEDLVAFGMSVLTGRLIADSTLKLMFRVPNTPDGKPPEGESGYALGWAIGDWYGVQEVSHGGGTPQVTGLLYLLPARRFVVAVMMNLESVPDRGDLAGDLAKIVLGPRAPHR